MLIAKICKCIKISEWRTIDSHDLHISTRTKIISSQNFNLYLNLHRVFLFIGNTNVYIRVDRWGRRPKMRSTVESQDIKALWSRTIKSKAKKSNPISTYYTYRCVLGPYKGMCKPLFLGIHIRRFCVILQIFVLSKRNMKKTIITCSISEIWRSPIYKVVSLVSASLLLNFFGTLEKKPYKKPIALLFSASTFLLRPRFFARPRRRQ